MLSKIILTNFMNIEFTEISGEEGINAYIGNNGQGKSAVFEAIAFVFLDRKKGGTFKDYIRIGENSCRVQIEWFIGQNPCYFDYEIVKNSGSVSRTIQYDNTKYSGTEDCQRFLKEHFDLKMLQDIVFNLQDSEAITNMAPADRREILQKVFNVNFEQGLIRLKNDTDAKNEEFKMVSMRKKILSEKSYPFMRLEIIPDESNLPIYKKEKEELALKVQKTDLTAINSKISSQNSIITGISQRLTQLTSNISSTESRIIELSGSITEKEKTGENDKTGLQKQLEDCKKLEEQLTSLYYESPEKIEMLEHDFANNRGELALFTRQLEMNKKGLCESCGQVCDPKHIAELSKKVEDTELIIKNLSADLALLKENNLKYKSIEDSIKNNKTFQNIISERISGSSQVIQAFLEEKNRAESSLETMKQEKTEKTLKLEEENKIITGFQSELQQKLEEQKALEPIKQKIAELTDKISIIEKAIIANSERTAMNKQLELQKEQDMKEIEELTVLEQGFIEQLDTMKQTKKIIETILPDFIISQACIILENFINDFIDSTGTDLVVKLVAVSTGAKSKGVQFYYRSHTGGENTISEWLPVNMASGYETALLTLAFKLAIAYMYQSDILLLDEPDKTATEDNSLLLFKHIANLEGFRQIFLISHRDLLKEWLKTEAEALIYKVENGIFYKEI